MGDFKHKFSVEADKIHLYENIHLHVPEGAFTEDTEVTWSVITQEGHLSDLYIVAKRCRDGEEIKSFQKYIRIIYDNVDCHCISKLEVTGDLSPTHPVPYQKIDEIVEEEDINNIYHTFYTFTDQSSLIIYTRHFSTFHILCKEHSANTDSYNANIFADLFACVQQCGDDTDVDLKVVLDVRGIQKSNKNPEDWKIQDSKKYVHLKSITLSSPPDSEVIENGSTFHCSAELSGDEWELVNESFPEPQPIENCIPCRECNRDIRPDAAVFQFHGSHVNVNYFAVKLEFKVELKKNPMLNLLKSKTPILTKHRQPINIEEILIQQANASADVEMNHDLKTETLTTADMRERVSSPMPVEDSSSPTFTIDHDGPYPSGIPTTLSTSSFSGVGRQGEVYVTLPRSSSQGELSDKMLVKLSEKISSSSELRKLGAHLFSDDKFEKYVNDKGKITDAAYGMLSEWSKSQDDRQSAFDVLVKALTDASLNSYATEVLGWNPRS